MGFRCRGSPNVKFGTFALAVGKPKVDADGGDIEYYAAHSRYKLVCAVQGYPLPTLRWEFQKFCYPRSSCDFEEIGHVRTNSQKFYTFSLLNSKCIVLSIWQDYQLNEEEEPIDIEATLYQMDSELVVTALQSGIYKCVAENAYGESDEDFISFFVPGMYWNIH